MLFEPNVTFNIVENAFNFRKSTATQLPNCCSIGQWINGFIIIKITPLFPFILLTWLPATLKMWCIGMCLENPAVLHLTIKSLPIRIF